MQGYVPETRFSLVSVDVIRQNVDGILSYFSETIFVLFLLTNSDLEGTETLDFVPETLFFLVSFIYRTLSALVILDLPFPLEDR